MNINELLKMEIGSIYNEMPFVADILDCHGADGAKSGTRLGTFLDSLAEDHFEDTGINKQHLINNLEQLLKLFHGNNTTNRQKIDSVTIIGGQNKSGVAEQIRLRLEPGKVTSIVGPTGSGKSRLLADIEWMAQADTPTGRRILINDATPDSELRFSLEHKLVAQLSQNMNFVMDTSVENFIRMHAESRMKFDLTIIKEIIDQANLLAGESFAGDTPITSLSGGQSRALMIADTAFLSSSPVVLIDEIENAGIDRKMALQLLIKQEKIVLMATHDPILALMAHQRIVIKNGGISKVIQTTAKERLKLSELEQMDARINSLRNRLRCGELIENV